jgi:hypothetical protein
MDEVSDIPAEPFCDLIQSADRVGSLVMRAAVEPIGGNLCDLLLGFRVEWLAFSFRCR